MNCNLIMFIFAVIKKQKEPLKIVASHPKLGGIVPFYGGYVYVRCKCKKKIARTLKLYKFYSATIKRNS